MDSNLLEEQSKHESKSHLNKNINEKRRKGNVCHFVLA